MNDIKIIACDLDGTLLHGDKTISQYTIDTLRNCAERGIHVVPATGRFYNGIPESLRKLPFIRYAITINGSAVLDVLENKTIYEATISSHSAVPILEYFNDLGVAYNFYSLNAGFMEKRFIDHIEDHLDSKVFQTTVRQLYTPVDDLISFMISEFDSIYKFQVFTKEPSKLRAASDFVNGLGLPLVVTSSFVYNLEVNSIDATKGKALNSLSEHLGVDIRDTAAFGDGGNDINMLEAAGYGIAMENARTPVKQIADFITLSNDKDGVASWINNNILK